MDAHSAVQQGLRGQSSRPKILTPEDEAWCELALGLGGRSIKEWQEALSEEEWAIWCAYRRKHGTLSPLLRLDGDIGRLGVIVARGAKLKKTDGSDWHPRDVIRWGEAPQIEEPEGSLQDVLALMGGKVRKGK